MAVWRNSRRRLRLDVNDATGTSFDAWNV